MNGNLAEMLQEPTLMGAYEGAGITVSRKECEFPPGRIGLEWEPKPHSQPAPRS